MVRSVDFLEMERRAQKINRWFIPLYCLLGVAAAIYYGIRKDMYHCPLAVGTLAIPLLIAAFYRIFHLKPVHQLTFVVLLFTLLGYTLGSVWEFYLLIPNFDKVVHMLSGVFVSMLALTLYCVVKPEHKLDARNCATAMLFVFFASMAVAGLWEITEYFVNLITGRDVQRVAATGVGDTMQDMIVCLIGTLAYLPLVRRACHGKPSVWTGMAEAFIQSNPQIVRQ